MRLLEHIVFSNHIMHAAFFLIFPIHIDRFIFLTAAVHFSFFLSLSFFFQPGLFLPRLAECGAFSISRWIYISAYISLACLLRSYHTYGNEFFLLKFYVHLTCAFVLVTCAYHIIKWKKRASSGCWFNISLHSSLILFPQVYYLRNFLDVAEDFIVIVASLFSYYCHSFVLSFFVLCVSLSLLLLRLFFSLFIPHVIDNFTSIQAQYSHLYAMHLLSQARIDYANEFIELNGTIN